MKYISSVLSPRDILLCTQRFAYSYSLIACVLPLLCVCKPRLGGGGSLD